MQHRFSLYTGLAAGALLLAACNAGEDLPGMETKGGNEISVSTYITAPTRAQSKTAFTQGDAFGLSAHEHEGTFPGVANSLINQIAMAIKSNPTDIETAMRATTFMFNETVTLDNGSWGYSPVKKWPDTEDLRLSFFAIYPRPLSTTLSRTAALQKKLGFEYTISTNPAEQQDIMWGSVVDAHRNDRNGTYVNGSSEAAAFAPTSGALQLKFSHAMARVSFKARAVQDANSGTDIKITSLAIENVKSNGQMIFADDLSNISWSGLSTPATYPVVGSNGVEPGSTASTLETMMLIPQTLASDACIRLTYTYNFNGEKHEINQSYSLAGTQWNTNTSYTYLLTINPASDNIIVNAAVNDWEETESKNL